MMMLLANKVLWPNMHTHVHVASYFTQGNFQPHSQAFRLFWANEEETNFSVLFLAVCIYVTSVKCEIILYKGLIVKYI